MMQKITIDVEIPDGYEFVRYGIPKENEIVVFQGCIARHNPNPGFLNEYVIVKRSAPIRWRAKVGGEFFYVKFNTKFELEIFSLLEFVDNADDSLFELGNYFRTRDEAKEWIIQKAKNI